MTKQSIITKFEKRNYRIVRCMSGSVVVTDPRGFGKSFESYAAAHRFYFN